MEACIAVRVRGALGWGGLRAQQACEARLVPSSMRADDHGEHGVQGKQRQQQHEERRPERLGRGRRLRRRAVGVGMRVRHSNALEVCAARLAAARPPRELRESQRVQRRRAERSGDRDVPVDRRYIRQTTSADRRYIMHTARR